MAGAMPQYGITELPKGYVEIESERRGASDLVAEDVEIIPVMVNGLDGQLWGRADGGMSGTRSHELIQIVVCHSI